MFEQNNTRLSNYASYIQRMFMRFVYAILLPVVFFLSGCTSSTDSTNTLQVPNKLSAFFYNGKRGTTYTFKTTEIDENNDTLYSQYSHIINIDTNGGLFVGPHAGIAVARVEANKQEKGQEFYATDSTLCKLSYEQSDGPILLQKPLINGTTFRLGGSYTFHPNIAAKIISTNAPLTVPQGTYTTIQVAREFLDTVRNNGPYGLVTEKWSQTWYYAVGKMCVKNITIIKAYNNQVLTSQKIRIEELESIH